MSSGSRFSIIFFCNISCLISDSTKTSRLVPHNFYDMLPHHFYLELAKIIVNYFLLTFIGSPKDGVLKLCEHLKYKPDEYKIGRYFY
jgi:hypothetical protein